MLREKWGRYYVFIWAKNRAFSRYQGRAIKKFINIIPDIVQWWNTHFMYTKHNENFTKGLQVWKDISTFLTKTVIFAKDFAQVFIKTLRLFKQILIN